MLTNSKTALWETVLHAPEGLATAATPAPVTTATTTQAEPATAVTATPPAEPGNLLGDTAATPVDPVAEAKPAEAKPAEAAALDATKFTLPEGVSLAPEGVAEFAKVATELGIDQAGAQRLVDLHTKAFQEAAQKPYQEWNAMQTKWVDEVKADKEIGGDKLPATLQTISRALDTFGDESTREAFKLTGAGNNPAVIRMMYRMAKQLTEGGFISGGRSGPLPSIGASAMYPNLPGA